MRAGSRFFRGVRYLGAGALLIGLFAVACDSTDLLPLRETPVWNGNTSDRTAEGESTWIYWGDNHVHTRFSLDAWIFMRGELDAKVDSDPAQACEFAYRCADLDFFVSTEHGMSFSDELWDLMRKQVWQCQQDVGDEEKFGLS